MIQRVFVTLHTSKPEVREETPLGKLYIFFETDIQVTLCILAARWH
jgi:hypothetical protein